MARERQTRKRGRSYEQNPFQNIFSFKPKNKKQADYIETIYNKDIVLAFGPAGTGKSICPTMVALQELIRGNISKIIFSRPTVELHSDESKGLGFLPGKINEKMQPYLRPVLHIMSKWVHEHHIHQLMNQKKIECIPLEYIRGNTFDDAYVILDEAQNASYKQIKSLLTRIGEGGKIILNGDIEQHDMRGEIGLEIWANLLTDVPEVGIIQFTEDEIVRNKLIRTVLKIARSYEQKEKNLNVWDNFSSRGKCCSNGHCSTEEIDT